MNEPKSSAGKEPLEENGSSSPPISFPKGGGAILGVGENFAANRSPARDQQQFPSTPTQVAPASGRSSGFPLTRWP